MRNKIWYVLYVVYNGKVWHVALNDSTVKISKPHLYLNLSQSALPFLWLNAQALLYDVVYANCIL